MAYVAGAVPENRIQEGARVGDYTVSRLIAEGGMGRVFSAVHAPTGQAVAIKVMRF